MLLLSFLGGVLPILSPCILPVIPIVFSRADRSFGREILPMLVGLAAVFAIVASVATVSAGWVVQANEIGRFFAIALLIVVSLSLLAPRFAELISRSLVRIGSGLDRRGNTRGGVGGNVAVCAAIGLLWAPCAGPILGPAGCRRRPRYGARAFSSPFHRLRCGRGDIAGCGNAR